MKKELCAWLAYALLVALLFFWAVGKLNAETISLRYIYCHERALIENLGRLYKEGGYAPANLEFAALLDRADGNCIGSTDELPLYIIVRGTKYRSDGSFLQVMGVSSEPAGDPTLWTIVFGRDGST